MKQLLVTSKGPRVLHVPSPLLEAGSVLVEVEYSLISTGTETATVQGMARQSRGVLQTVAANPSMLARLTEHLREAGVRKTVSKVSGYLAARERRRDTLIPVGYSCSGCVVGVGRDVEGFTVGDRVACAGSSQATHSELVVVPTPLVVKVPEECSMAEAAGVAVGSIAMQGVRRAAPELMDMVAVIGLGLLGITTVQLLRAAGARVVGLDIDPARVANAGEIGLEDAFTHVPTALERVDALTQSHGADVTIITAGGTTDEIIRTAVEITRERGRIVVVGKVGMSMDVGPFLRKELEVRASRSYGPGRYDRSYEEEGIDYPYPYVRWTEGRNMEAYLALAAEGRVHLHDLLETLPFTEGESAYRRLQDDHERPLGYFLKYPSGTGVDAKSQSKAEIRAPHGDDRIGVGVVGAGAFVQRVHLPNLGSMAGKVDLVAVLNRTGAKAHEVAQHFGAAYSTTSFEEVIGDPDVDVVLIGTRHQQHAGMALDALNAGKHVIVEKPLAMTRRELSDIEGFFDSADSAPLLLTGFNRRFSPVMVELKRRLEGRGTPLIILYQMNAGALPVDHWLRSDEGGGRNIGEACHIYDLFLYLTGSEPVELSVNPARISGEVHAQDENFVATIGFADGSVCTLLYTSLGNKQYPKETAHVYVDGSVHVMNNFESLESHGGDWPVLHLNQMAKGHAEELRAFIDAVREGRPSPIPVEDQLLVSRITLDIQDHIEDEVPSTDRPGSAGSSCRGTIR